MNVRRIKAIQDSKGDENLQQEHCRYSKRQRYVDKHYPAVWHLLKKWQMSCRGFPKIIVRQFAVSRVFGIGKVNSNELKLQAYHFFTRIPWMANTMWFCKVDRCVLSVHLLKIITF